MPNQKKSNTTSWDARKVREAQESAQDAPRKRKKKKRFPLGLYLLCVVIISAVLAGVGWLLANDLCSLDKEPATLVITVEEDDSVSDVAQKLKDGGLIKYKGFFCLMGKFFHAKSLIDPGTYELTSDMDYRCLIQSMHDYGAREVVRVTIPEGMTVKDVIDILVENHVSTREGLEDAAANYDFKDYEFLDDSRKGDIARLEGYLFPDTYDFYVWEEPESALARMLNNFNARTADLMEEIQDSGHSLHDIITVASIVEREGTGDAEERGNIASVLYNRINNPSRETAGFLQLDTTVYYALALEGKDKTAFTTELDSPYNTYLHPGLPVGPICNPSVASIKAAIHPSSTDYYYFAAGKDGINHFFTNSDDHYAFVNSDMYQPD